MYRVVLRNVFNYLCYRENQVNLYLLIFLQCKKNQLATYCYGNPSNDPPPKKIRISKFHLSDMMATFSTTNMLRICQ